MTNLTSFDSLLPEFESLPRWLLIPFVIISIIESIIGVIGNILVILILLFFGKSNTLQALHNCFIINLALSDFVLCLFTMPLNTYRSLYIYMAFPPAFCKLADSFPAINICVSSLTIVTISIYRYLLVYYPHKQSIGTFSTCIIMISIWLLAICAASPLFIYSRSIPAYDESLIDTLVKDICTESLDNSCETKYSIAYKRLHVCHESWPKQSELHLLYTIFMLFLQFILPIFIICITYYQIMVKLRERFRFRFLMKRHNIASLRHEIRRQRRNNVLLLLIVSLYAISWLPFNISYILFTYANRFHVAGDIHSLSDQKSNELSKYFPLRFLICMISAITNPFLYSYFNETFKDGLQKLFSSCCPRMNREINQISFDTTICSTNQINLDKISLHNRQSNLLYNQPLKIFNGNLKHNSSVSRLTNDQSTKLTILSSTNFPTSISSAM
ncbi:unnamed protein product [Rotaria sordida]|uniref:G-protein coupled receptors family 1 profile domain-containing protein n=2 Tax=Rotaria sordida TaxID=392033 RepID=A0A818QSU8_9BILA|nr:unnamed protein product [Rotaria sordida]CAF1326084.1 unnamed protein product [Rotaria sordida]CAF1449091.1 unnamed protein product [Rotaria sordida]CAF3631928.1 unnamed protein product [Rotaria sordida]CAF3645824.1 unnamed protein product [Rotaria sordida]